MADVSAVVCKQGQTLHSQARAIILNAYKYFSDKKASQGDIINETSLATGVSASTIKRIIAEGRNAINEHGENTPVKFSTPGKKRPRSSPVTHLDDFDTSVVRATISQIFREGNYPTINSIKQKLIENIAFTGSTTSLHRILTKKLKLRFGKIDNRKFYIERPEIVAHRHKYLRQIKQYREELPDTSFIYLDETWVNQHHGKSKQWHDDKYIRGRHIPTGKGRRLILTHAGSVDGFVSNAQLLFRSRTNSANYHDEMNNICFGKWFEEQLLPNIPEKCVIIMDNAPYHSKQLEKTPTTASRKSEMIAWLNKKGIAHSSNMLKVDLYDLIKQHKPNNKVYEIDELAKSRGHVVLRLPPYHCDMNPIELIWAQVKEIVRSENVSFKLSDVEQLISTAIQRITTSNWRNAIKHVLSIEQLYFDTDRSIEDLTEPLIINFSGDTDSSSSDEDLGVNEIPKTP